MAIVLPKALKAGELAKAADVMENFDALAAATEGVATAASGTDVYQAGVVVGTDWKNVAATTINSSTGALTIPILGGSAWLPGVSGSLVRTFTPEAEYKALAPPSLPASGGWKCIGVELTASGSQAVVSLVSGEEKVSEAEALAHSPAVTAGKTRIKDVPLLNTGGVYSIGTPRDRRPWARGSFARQERTSGSIALGAEAALDATNLSVRLETTGNPLELALMGITSTDAGAGSSGIGEVLFWQDGVKAGTTTEWGGIEIEGGLWPLAARTVLLPSAGSHLFRPAGRLVAGKGAHVRSEAGRPLVFIARELLTPPASNGTS